MKIVLPVLCYFLFTYAIAQENDKKPNLNDALQKFGFLEGKVVDGSDTSIYYLRSYDQKPGNLVVFIQGTDPNPIFTYRAGQGLAGISRWFSDDYKSLDSLFTYAIVAKPGMDGIFDRSKLGKPQEYLDHDYLEYRVNQVDIAINDIVEKHLDNPGKIVVYGHSEGATIAAALALKNKHMTHLGFWSGNVLNNFYEFALFNRIEALKGQISDTLAHQNIMEIVGWYSSVIDDPNSTKPDAAGYTNKRWSSHEKAPIETLLQVDIPIFAYFASEDESTPIETAYLVPIQFMQHRKTNLTFDVCLGCDHSYIIEKEGKPVNLWPEVFRSFMNWVNAN